MGDTARAHAAAVLRGDEAARIVLYDHDLPDLIPLGHYCVVRVEVRPLDAAPVVLDDAHVLSVTV